VWGSWGGGAPAECITDHWRRRLLRWVGHLGRMEDTRRANQLLWSSLPGGSGRPGRRSKSCIPHVYDDLFQTLGSARRQFQDSMEAEGKPMFGFSWLDACADRDAWRELIG
jgi:hypothetical protein